MKEKFVVLLFFFAFWNVSAHIIILRDGSFYRGKIDLKDNEVDLEMYNGQKKKFQKKIVLKILFSDITDAEVLKITEVEKAKMADQKKATELANKVTSEKIKQIENQISNKKQNENETIALKAEIEKLKKQLVEIEEESMINPMSPVWRSALLPGWGNTYIGFTSKNTSSKVIGLTYSTLFYLTLIYMADRRIETDKTFSRYETYVNNSLFYNILLTQGNIDYALIGYLSNSSNQLYSDFRSTQMQYNTAAQLLGFFYFLQIVHAYISGRGVNSQYIKDIASSENTSRFRIEIIPTANLPSGKLETRYGLFYSLSF